MLAPPGLSRLLFLVPAGLIAFCAGREPVHAQVEPGELVVTVRAADTGRALPGAHVVVSGIGVGGATDAVGVARLEGLLPGARSVVVRYLGYGTETARVMLEPGRRTSLTFELPVRAIPLAAVRVKTRPSALRRNGFYDRRGSGFGSFITREEIERAQPRYLSDMLRRVGGVTLTPSRFGGSSGASIRGAKVITGSCPIQYYIDGTMTAMFNIDEVQPDQVEGVEVYRGGATIPPVFNKGTAMCGVVVIWTRSR